MWRFSLATLICPPSRLPSLKFVFFLLQDPAAADKLAKIQRDLDETKIILHKTIESVLDRGEKLDQVGEPSSIGASKLIFTNLYFDNLLTLGFFILLAVGG